MVCPEVCGSVFLPQAIPSAGSNQEAPLSESHKDACLKHTHTQIYVRSAQWMQCWGPNSGLHPDAVIVRGTRDSFSLLMMFLYSFPPGLFCIKSLLSGAPRLPRGCGMETGRMHMFSVCGPTSECPVSIPCPYSGRPWCPSSVTSAGRCIYR